MIGTILGRLGRDAEISTTSGGTQYVKFTLAENVYRNGKDETIWYDIVSYDPFVVKTQMKVLKKGSFAIVVGDVDTKVNVAKNGSIYINQHITASSIKIPYLGNGERKTNDSPIQEETTMTTPKIEMPKMTLSQPVEAPQINAPDDDEDGLPF